MKSQPESVTWDHKNSTHNPCNLQFYTSHLCDWKQECPSFYIEKAMCITWKTISSGDQLTVQDHVTINFYEANIVMVQGRNFVDWGQNEFPTIKARLDSKSPPLTPNSQQLQVRQKVCNTSVSTLVPTPSPMTCLHLPLAFEEEHVAESNAVSVSGSHSKCGHSITADAGADAASCHMYGSGSK